MMVCAGLFLTTYSFIFRVGRKILSNESVSETNYNMEEVEATMVEVNFNRSIPISKHENTSSITKLCEWSEKEFWIAVCFVAYIALTVCDFGNSLLVLFYGCQSPISFLEMKMNRRKKTKRNLGGSKYHTSKDNCNAVWAHLLRTINCPERFNFPFHTIGSRNTLYFYLKILLRHPVSSIR
ncbi:hypothetical protein L2E82_51638 [Cichorium intybus]|nr:hypothetical protein L2E82_51638 [Cichorium intybus]